MSLRKRYLGYALVIKWLHCFRDFNGLCTKMSAIEV